MADKFKSCSIGDCKGNAHRTSNGRAGMCLSHYNRLRKYGDPLIEKGTSRGIPHEYLINEVLPYEGDDCLIWPYARSSWKYGSIWIDGKSHKVHRISCEHANGPSPSPKHEAAHECGNGHLGCVNPRHVTWKTRSDNQLDRATHGTSNRGERSGKAKLTEDQVRQIKAFKGQIGNRRLAKMFGVQRGTTMCIHRGKSWSWLEV